MRRAYLTLMLLVGVLALAGCGRNKPPAGPNIDGVTVDMARFQRVFAAASPQLETSVTAVRIGVRYGNLAAALAELEKLATHPSLTETQKQVVALLTGQIQQVASKQPPPPAQ